MRFNLDNFKQNVKYSLNNVKTCASRSFLRLRKQSFKLIVAVISRICEALCFWFDRMATRSTKRFLFLLASGVITSVIIEAWRAIGFHHLGGFPLNLLPLSTAPLFSFLFYPIMLISDNAIYRGLLLIIFSFLVTGISQYLLSTPSIIASVWYPVLGSTLSIIYYSQGFEDLQRNLNSISSISANSNKAKHVIDLISDRSKFYIDRWIVSALSLGAALGGMMTILWGDPYGAFIGTRAQKLTDGIYMILVFFLVLVISAVGFAYPAHRIYKGCVAIAMSLPDKDI